MLGGSLDSRGEGAIREGIRVLPRVVESLGLGKGVGLGVVVSQEDERPCRAVALSRECRGGFLLRGQDPGPLRVILVVRWSIMGLMLIPAELFPARERFIFREFELNLGGLSEGNLISEAGVGSPKNKLGTGFRLGGQFPGVEECL